MAGISFSEASHPSCPEWVIEFQAVPLRDTQVVLLNAHNMGANKFLSARKVAQLRQKGKMTLLGRAIPEWLHMRGTRKGPPLVHRVDGVPENGALWRETVADRIHIAVNRLDRLHYLSDRVLQNQLCRTLRNLTRPIGASSTTRSIQRCSSRTRTSCGTVGTLRLMSGVLVVEPAQRFRNSGRGLRALSGVELTFAGNWCHDVDPANVNLARVLNSHELAALMRSNHVTMIHAAWNESLLQRHRGGDGLRPAHHIPRLRRKPRTGGRLRRASTGRPVEGPGRHAEYVRPLSLKGLAR